VFFTSNKRFILIWNKSIILLFDNWKSRSYNCLIDLACLLLFSPNKISLWISFQNNVFKSNDREP
jgi:hypothetical protein